MTAELAVVVYVALIAFGAPAVVARWRWLERAPGLGVAIWLAMAWSMAAVIVLAGVTLALESEAVRDFVAELIRVCTQALHEPAANVPPTAIGGGVCALLVAAARIVRSAFPFLPAARHAPRAVGFFVERLADERASRRHDRADVAKALLTAASAKVPNGALGIGGETVARRVLGLLSPVAPVSRTVRLAGVAMVGLFLAVPATVTSALEILLEHCPLPFG